MKKEEIKERIKEILEVNQFEESLEKEIDRLLNSGGIDIESEPKESYIKAKIVLYVALKNIAEKFAPLPAYKKEVKNLEKF